MAVQKIILENSGLVLNSNPYQTNGSTLSLAENVDIVVNNVFEVRHGFEVQAMLRFQQSHFYDEKCLGVIMLANDEVLVVTNQHVFITDAFNSHYNYQSFTKLEDDFCERLAAANEFEFDYIETNDLILFLAQGTQRTNNQKCVIKKIRKQLVTVNNVKQQKVIRKVLPMGIVRSLTPRYQLENSDDAAALAADDEVIYRCVWSEVQTHRMGAPSALVHVKNTRKPGSQLSSKHTVKLTIDIPIAIQSNLFNYQLEIYRSHIAKADSDDIKANDDLFRLVTISFKLQNLQTVASLASINYWDRQTPSAAANVLKSPQRSRRRPLPFAYLRKPPPPTVEVHQSTKVPLYTNEELEGSANANEIPPLCTTMCNHKNMAFYGNVTEVSRLFIDIVGWNKSENVNAFLGGRIVITNGVKQFIIVAQNTETLEAGNNIWNFKVNDINSFIAAINLHPNNDFVNAYYISNFNGGSTNTTDEESINRVLLEVAYSDKMQSVAITLIDSFAATLALGKTIKRALAQENESELLTLADSPVNNDVRRFALQERNFKNRLYVSKPLQVEAVPLYQYIHIGKGDKSILKLFSFGEHLCVFTEEGLFYVDGNNFSELSVRPFLSDLVLASRQSICVLNETMHCFTNQGIVAVNDGSYSIISREIDNAIFAKLHHEQNNNIAFANFYSSSFAISTHNKYLFFIKQAFEQAEPNLAYVFHYTTKSWTQILKSASCGTSNKLERLYLASASNFVIEEDSVKKKTTRLTLLAERRRGNVYDYRDESYLVKIISFDTSSKQVQIDVPLTSNEDDLDFLRQGMFLSQSLSNSEIENVVIASNTIQDENHNLTKRATLTLKTMFVISLDVPAEINVPIHYHMCINRFYLKHISLLKKVNAIYFLFGQTRQINVTICCTTDESPYWEKLSLNFIPGEGFGVQKWNKDNFGGNQPVSQEIKTTLPRNKNTFNWLVLSISNKTIFSNIKFFGITMEYNFLLTKKPF